jgi:glycerophosphoryl diester phosphodiesterase
VATSSERALLLAAALAVGSCDVRTASSLPSFGADSLLAGATPLSAASLKALQARFQSQKGNDVFGGRVVTRASPGHLSIFGPTQAIYAILTAGCRDGGETLVLEGYWRYAETTDAGLVQLKVGPPAAVRSLCAGEPIRAHTPLTLDGVTGEGSDTPVTPIHFTYEAPLVDHVGKFMAISHHGTSTNQDYGASENTLEGMILTEAMGADAVEIDVRLTKDSVPILFHDATLSGPLVQGRFCRGAIADLTFAEIRAACVNLRGEPIYSLAEGLRGAMDRTSLRGAWIDVKEPEGVAPTLAVMAEMDAYADAIGRDFFHVIGLADADIAAAYTAAAPPAATQCLVEYDWNVAVSLGCIAWGPRFTEGPQPDQVAAAQAAGLAVYFWTVDGVPFITDYLQTAKPNGMITDTPGLAFYVYQAAAWKPAGGHEPTAKGHGSK